MAGVTALVDSALAKLGPEATDQEVRAYIGERDSTVPLGHVSLALRKLRGKVTRSVLRKCHAASGSQRSLFSD